MKVSYLLATSKPTQCAEAQINRILSLEPHDFEIVVCSKNEDFKRFKNVKFVLEETVMGAGPAFNTAYKHSSGELIVLTTDDHILPLNFLDIFKELNSFDVKKQKCRLGTLSWGIGGPGYRTWDKRIKDFPPNSLWHLNTIHPQNWPNAIPYYISTFPVLFHQDIEVFLNGVIFNESFRQAFSDNWLSRYIYHINEGVEVSWPREIWNEVDLNVQNMLGTSQFKNDYWHNQDYQVYLKLVSLIHTGIPYNHRIYE